MIFNECFVLSTKLNSLFFILSRTPDDLKARREHRFEKFGDVFIPASMLRSLLQVPDSTRPSARAQTTYWIFCGGEVRRIKNLSWPRLAKRERDLIYIKKIDGRTWYVEYRWWSFARLMSWLARIHYWETIVLSHLSLHYCTLPASQIMLLLLFSFITQDASLL